MDQQTCTKQTENKNSNDYMNQQTCTKQTEDKNSNDCMAQQTLKRKAEDRNSDNDNLNDDDATWGGKRCRYRYNYILELPESNSTISDDTESVYSNQSKSTALVVSEEDSSSSVSSSGDNCCYMISSNGEFELADTSSSCSSKYKSSTSDTTTEIEFEVTNAVKCDKMTDFTDNDDTDTLKKADDTQKKNVPPPACFKLCLQCGKRNHNPYFQYCYLCFEYRMSLVVNKPKAKPKGVKRLNVLHREKEYNSLKASGSTSNPEQPISGLDSSPGEKNDNLCKICFIMPKNGIFNHGKTGHIYCCYPCAKRLRKKSDKCPICNLKIKYITRMITV